MRRVAAAVVVPSCVALLLVTPPASGGLRVLGPADRREGIRPPTGACPAGHLAADEKRSPAVGDRHARELLERALARRYAWPEVFPGFSGVIEITETGREPLRGSFEVTTNLSVKVDAPDEPARAALRDEIGSFITQCRPLAFDLTHAHTKFITQAARPDGAVVIAAAGDPLATTYTVKDGQVVEVSRLVGRVRQVARERARLATNDGRAIASEYDIVRLSSTDGRELSTERTSDAYMRIDGLFLPTGRRVERTSAGAPDVLRQVTLTALKVHPLH